MTRELRDLCELGEEKPKGGGNNYVVWHCQRCRWAWIAAVMDGSSMPWNPERQVQNARAAAAKYNDAQLALAAEVLNARITPDVGHDGGTGF